jgi:hypothetical protein
MWSASQSNSIGRVSSSVNFQKIPIQIYGPFGGSTTALRARKCSAEEAINPCECEFFQRIYPGFNVVRNRKLGSLRAQ